MKKDNIIVTDVKSVAPIKMEFDLAVFDLNTIKKALLKFTGLGSFAFEHRDNMINVTVHLLDRTVDASNIEHMIRTEVLDQDLRKKVSEETEGIRNIILANAFSNTKLISFDG